MRPGQSCPGVVDIDVDWRGAGACFNEAGAIMPRSGKTPRRSRSGPRWSFNEAGAIMPRSGGNVVANEKEHENCFNEAGAIMPRSGDENQHVGCGGRRASMRPGQSCPGVVSW